MVGTGTLDAAAVRPCSGILPAGTWELVTHPGYNDADLAQVRTRLLASREIERNALLSVKNFPEIELISFAGLGSPTAIAGRRLTWTFESSLPRERPNPRKTTRSEEASCASASPVIPPTAVRAWWPRNWASNWRRWATRCISSPIRSPFGSAGATTASFITRFRSRAIRCSSFRRTTWRWPRAWRKLLNSMSLTCCMCTMPFPTR